LFDAKPPMIGQVMTAGWPVAIMRATLEHDIAPPTARDR
jgi:hypothetical protein